ncbi:hypothetical protein D3C87_1705600 [compost metagenome]
MPPGRGYGSSMGSNFRQLGRGIRAPYGKRGDYMCLGCGMLSGNPKQVSNGVP